MRIRFWLAVAAVSIAIPSTASAEEAVETAIRQWVATLDASPELSASFSGIFYDAISDTARVSDLVIRPETTAPGTLSAGLSIDTLTVSGYVEQPEGFKARSIKADSGAIEAGVMTLRFSDVSLSDLYAPFGISFTTYDPAKPFSSIMAAYRGLLGIDLAEATIGTMAVDQLHQGVNSTAVYRDMIMTGMADGKVARFDVGKVSTESPSPQGLVTMTIDSIESRDTDLAAFVHVYDPAAYVDGRGDMIWRDALAYGSYKNIVMEVPGAKIRLGDVIIEDFRLRQPPESFVGFFDEMIANPDMPEAQAERAALRVLPSMFASFSVGRMAMLNMSVEAMGIDHLAIRDIHFNDMSIDGLGEFGIEGLGAVVQGQGAIEFERFAFGDISFGGYDALMKLVAAAEQPNPPADVENLVPRLGFAELTGLELQTPDIPRLSLERFRTDLADYIGLIPTRATAEMSGLSVPVSAIGDASARDMLRRLGYDRVSFGFGLDAEYDQTSERITVDEMRYSIDNVGAMMFTGVFGGLPVAALRDEALLEQVSSTLLLERASFTFKDDSIVGKALDILASYMNAPPEAFRKQFADAMPFLLSIAVQNDPQLMAIINRSGLFKQLTPVVRDFVANPGSSITVSLDPPTPVALEAISNAVENAPDTVAQMLGLSITGAKGTLSPQPEPEPVEVDPGGQGMTPAVEPTAPGGGDGGKTPAAPKPGAPAGTEGGSTPASRDGAE